jgi:trk system potassium uptake protein TrkH
MLFSGINFSLWYTLFFNSKQRFKPFLKSLELKFFLGLTLLLTAFIFIDLQQHNFYSSPVDTLRYSFFNVATIISTTGLSNYDFSTWPSISKSLLLLVYFTGGSVGSTSGGVKLGRFIMFFTKRIQF